MSLSFDLITQFGALGLPSIFNPIPGGGFRSGGGSGNALFDLAISVIQLFGLIASSKGIYRVYAAFDPRAQRGEASRGIVFFLGGLALWHVMTVARVVSNSFPGVFPRF